MASFYPDLFSCSIEHIYMVSTDAESFDSSLHIMLIQRKSRQSVLNLFVWYSVKHVQMASLYPDFVPCSVEHI